MVTAFGFAVVGALGLVVADQGGKFLAGARAAPAWVLGAAVALHVLWLLARSEAWASASTPPAVPSAGGASPAEPPASATSATSSTAQFGLAVRIAALRRSAPAESPRASVLVAAELPIVVIEAALAAICSFTLVAPLGIPWWLPLLCFGAMAAVVAALQRRATAARVLGQFRDLSWPARAQPVHNPGLRSGGAADRP